MKELLQGQNPIILLALCCVGMVVFGGVIGIVLQVLGVGFGIIFQGIGAVLHVISGGPVAWCGCLLMMIACAGCGIVTVMVASALPQCGTAQAVNLCRLFGY